MRCRRGGPFWPNGDKLGKLLLSLLAIMGLLVPSCMARADGGEAIALPDEAWRVLTWRWAVFFLGLALLNIFIWFNFSESVWVAFKAFGILGLTVVFALANGPYMAKHMIEGPPEK